MLKKYRQSFATSELGRLHSLFPFSELARQMHLKSSPFGRKSYFSPEGKIALMVLKSYTNFSDAQLIEHLNGNIHYQLFCGVQIDPLHPLTNPKIVSAIRQEHSELDTQIEYAQEELRRDMDAAGRRKLLRLLDAQNALQVEATLMSFTAGFKLAAGIAGELGAPYSFEADEEQNAKEMIVNG